MPQSARLKAFRNHIEIEQNTPIVHTVRFQDVRAGWQQWLLLTGDRHHDNIHTDQALEKRHLDMALERDALLFDVGDWHCAMQGKGDPRGNYDELRPEHRKAKYLDALVDTEVPFYRPYADHFGVLGEGNHEVSVEELKGTNLTDRLVSELRKGANVNCYAGGYGGWVRFMFTMRKTVCRTLSMKYNHGSGGGAVMSFGTLDIRREASYLPDADIVVNAHTHDGYVVPLARERLSSQGVPYQDTAWYLRTLTYKDEWTGVRHGYAVKKSKGGPKPLGCIWGRFYCEDDTIRVEFSQMAK